jgi:hypothetical protein
MSFLRRNLWILLAILSVCLSAMAAQNAKKPADKEDLVWPARLLGYIRPENTMGNILIRNCRT